MFDILIIDDNQDICDVICDNLELSGFRVLATTTNVNVISLLISHPSIRLVVTDLIMPKRSGDEVIDDILTYNPAMNIIAMSGGLHDGQRAIFERAQQLGVEHILSKPVDMDALERIIHQYLR